MSLTSIEVVNVLYQYVKNSVLFSDAAKPTGKLKKYQRAVNSNDEDVVINGLPINEEPVQECVLNINVYVSNYETTNNGVIDKSEPDTERILYLSKLAKQALNNGKEIWDVAGNYCFKLQQDRIEPDDNYQHYINFRVEFYSLNI